MEDNTNGLLRALLQLAGRAVFREEQLRQIVLAKGASQKQLRAYNLCDGSRGQAQIGSELRLDAGNFSRTVRRWQQAGVIFKLGEGREAKLLHLYELPEENARKKRNDNG